MNQQQINQFEKPIFSNYEAEKNRLLASQVELKLNLSVAEFWTYFIEYTFKQLINKNLELENLHQGMILNLTTENNSMRSFLITQYLPNQVLELATLKDNILNKIFLRVEPTKYAQEIKIYYLESKRTNELIDRKTHRQLLANFNAKTLNKVLNLKEYLLVKIRKK